MTSFRNLPSMPSGRDAFTGIIASAAENATLASAWRRARRRRLLSGWRRAHILAQQAHAEMAQLRAELRIANGEGDEGNADLMVARVAKRLAEVRLDREAIMQRPESTDA